MSALGQKQTSAHVRVMSALPPKADIEKFPWNVRFVPKADIAVTHLQQEASIFLWSHFRQLLGRVES
jgi:hypothetical protein